jgi:hypothetical protein
MRSTPCQRPRGPVATAGRAARFRHRQRVSGLAGSAQMRRSPRGLRSTYDFLSLRAAAGLGSAHRQVKLEWPRFPAPTGSYPAPIDDAFICCPDSLRRRRPGRAGVPSRPFAFRLGGRRCHAGVDALAGAVAASALRRYHAGPAARVDAGTRTEPRLAARRAGTAVLRTDPRHRHAHRPLRRATTCPSATASGASIPTCCWSSPARCSASCDVGKPDAAADRVLGGDQPLVLPSDQLLATRREEARQYPRAWRSRSPAWAVSRCSAACCCWATSSAVTSCPWCWPRATLVRAHRAVPVDSRAGSARRVYQVSAVPVPLLASARDVRPDARSAAYLHSATMVKAGVFLLLPLLSSTFRH